MDMNKDRKHDDVRAVGIVAEYNPFHNGHEYHIKKAKSRSGADFAVVVMSPDFVQRGEPAIADKYTRTRMALSCGADLVLELPVCFACGSAEFFAEGAVRILDLLGCVNTICFGCETPDVHLLSKVASVLLREPPVFVSVLKGALACGAGFPQARELALAAALSGITADDLADLTGHAGVLQRTPADCTPSKKTAMARLAEAISQKCSGIIHLSEHEALSVEELSALLRQPNNILALEYIKSLQKRRSNIIPLAIRREGGGYSDAELPCRSSFASAASIRKVLAETSAGDAVSGRNTQAASAHAVSESLLSPYIPESALVHLTETVSKNGLPLRLVYDRLIRAKLISAYGDPQTAGTGHAEGSRYLDMDKALEDRIRKICREDLMLASDLPDLIDRLCTKQITRGRVKRVLAHTLLDIRADRTEQLRGSDDYAYARILGFRKEAAPLLRKIKEEASLPLITKPADAGKILNGPALQGFRQDVTASHIYQLLIRHSPDDTGNEYRHSPILWAEGRFL